MKKKILALVLSMATVVCMTACSGGSGTTAPPITVAGDVQPESMHAVTINVDCEENLFFSKYDVNVYIDGTLAGNINHGKKATYTASLASGVYTIKFVNEDESSVKGSVDVEISKDENLKFKVSCTSSCVNVEVVSGTVVHGNNSELGDGR